MGERGSLELLRLEIETLWETDAAGRLVRSPPPLEFPPPLVAAAASSCGAAWALSVAVPDEVVEAVSALLAGARGDRVGWAPDRAEEVAAVLGGGVRVQRGPSYVVAEPLAPPAGVEIRTGDADALRGLMPEDDRRSLRPPWAVAMVDGAVAAVCETARSTARGAEAGVWTYEQHRGRGLASAVTAAWSGLVGDRTAFYSTSDDNHGSMGVARRLGLRPLGQWWQAHRA